MSTPETQGKKAPQFSSFKLAPAPQPQEDCCCDSQCATAEAVPESALDARYSWVVNGMDCAACARKVETAASQVAGVKQAKVLFATEKLLVEADEDIRAQVEKAVAAAGYTLRSEDEPQPEVPESHLKENLPLIALVVMMAISWGLEQFNHPFGNLAFIATTLVGLYPIARQALRLMKSGSWFAIETARCLSAQRRKRRWCCCCF